MGKVAHGEEAHGDYPKGVDPTSGPYSLARVESLAGMVRAALDENYIQRASMGHLSHAEEAHKARRAVSGAGGASFSVPVETFGR